MTSAIAIVGMACRFPDARTPEELWENVLAQRRAFRRLPPERLSLKDYFSADPSKPDAIYASHAAVIEGYEFDRVRFRVAGATFRSVDLSHWLALDVADQALRDAGFVDGEGLPLETTGVLVGNTLTGEFSRAASLRLRWPYVRRVVESQLVQAGWDVPRIPEFLEGLETAYKSPFPEVGEETLAGALSNTIAGRICNYFHFGGGGYTVDGACASSLLAIARACSALETGEIDAALVGGVDLSLDPFELVGFSKAGALARGEMLVYDTNSSGFLPGEGCGFVVLMRADDANSRNLRTYAIIRGWGISSDGAGSITRPDMRGQTLALQRAYKRANYGIDTVALFEGHGTGTPVGDEVELNALSRLRKEAGLAKRPAAIGSVKANIGHTKAAAGIAGLIKASLAVGRRVIPPTTGVRQPRSEVAGDGAVLRVLSGAEIWPGDIPVRAGVNSFGFGGINVHIAIEGHEHSQISVGSATGKLIGPSMQDAEIFLFDGESFGELKTKIEGLAHFAATLSLAEITDLSAALAKEAGHGRVRAAIVASTPEELAARVVELHAALDKRECHHLNFTSGLFVANRSVPPRIGLLFPGQASPVRLSSGIHGQRFEDIAALYLKANLPSIDDGHSTQVAQLSIATAELAGISLLKKFGVSGSVAIGHSLGELTAYCWAEAFDAQSHLEIVRLRGRAMSRLSEQRGTMASISANAEEVAALIERGEVVFVACINAENRTVISGTMEAVARVVARAKRNNWTATTLSTADAFHSPLMAEAANQFRDDLSLFEIRPLAKEVISTITGTKLASTADLHELLIEQLTNPVRFMQAVAVAESEIDMLIEVGPGTVLTNLLESMTQVPVVSLDTAGSSISGLLKAVGAAYALGAPTKWGPLLDNRFTRPIDFRRPLKFFVNPCELGTTGKSDRPALEPFANSRRPEAVRKPAKSALVNAGEADAISVIRNLVALQTELPLDTIADSARLFGDLHLNSIVVGEIAANAAHALHVTPPAQVLAFADATVGELAKTLEQLKRSEAAPSRHDAVPAGIDDWCHAFVINWRPAPLRSPVQRTHGAWSFFGLDDHPWLQLLSRTPLPGEGALVCIPNGSIEDQASVLVAGARHVISSGSGERHFAVVGPVALADAFARTLNLENKNILTRVVEVPPELDVVNCLLAELSATCSHAAARYDSHGVRYEQTLELLKLAGADGRPVDRGDTVLVTGGAKGIAAECAYALAQDTGARLVLLGRSAESDSSVTAHLRRLKANGVEAMYIQADITRADEVKVAVDTAEQIYGPIVAIIHGAGTNQPALFSQLDDSDIHNTLAPKVKGFRNLVESVDTSRLRLFVSFGSVIGRIGLWGEAHYALANASLSALTDDFARLHPHCRCLAFESSAWSGIGMAERLGKLAELRDAGISPIRPAEGVSWFSKLIDRNLPANAVVLSGRLGANPPIPSESSSLPLRRFIERPRVYYPGIELISDCELTTVSDPYLLDHVFLGQPLLPGVLGIEAMVQVATALYGVETIPIVEQLHFEHPIVIDPANRVTLRIAALRRDDKRIDVVIRSSQTSFQLDHFRCSCDFRNESAREDRSDYSIDSPRIPLDPRCELYGSLLFQGPRFQRLKCYRRLSAQFSCAEISSAPATSWFTTYLPGKLILGDPAARDAALHSIQACVPEELLLPLSVDRIELGRLDNTEEMVAHASERWHEGNTYCYDLEVRAADGTLRERWHGLRLRKVEYTKSVEWPDPLMGVLLERRLGKVAPGFRIAAAFERDKAADRHSRTQRALERALNAPCTVRWRIDGKPEVGGPLVVSAAHNDGLTLAVAAPEVVACDLESIQQRPEETWRNMLGPDRWMLARLISNEAKEDLHTSATRVWTAMETLAKAQAAQSGPLVLQSCSVDRDHVVSLSAPDFVIATTVLRFRDNPTPLAVAVLTRTKVCMNTSIGTESVLKKQIS